MTVVTIDRPRRRNAVDRVTADALEAAFAEFDADGTASVARSAPGLTSTQ